MHRRTFVVSAAAALAAVRAKPAGEPVKLGIDLFSVRSQGWSPIEALDYCARWKVKVVHFSEIRFIGSLEPDNLKRVRAHAEKLGIDIEIGMRSICPSSKAFDPKAGTAEEQLSRMIDSAKIVGAKLVRAFLGTSADRTGPVPIEGHIDNAVKVLRAVKSKAVDNNLKIAIENHSGDMQGRELKMLIEAAGPDFVGACVDSGNPVWAIEDPHLTLETLRPYVLTSHVRDSYVWRVPEGAAVRWVRMGEGNVGIDDWVRKFSEWCPGRALSLEVIVTGPRIFAFHDPRFWDAYRRTPAWEFARFLGIADRGRPQTYEAPPRNQAGQREREDLEASLDYAQKLLKIA